MPVVITPDAILSYPNLFEPRVGPNGGDAVYSCSLVFPEGTDLEALQKSAMEALRDKFGAKTDALLKASKLRLPFRSDGDEKGYPEGSIFVNVKSKQAPGLVQRYAGPDGKPARITDPKELYPGCHVRASVKAFAYDTQGNKGASFGLNNIQKLGEGEHLDGRKRAEDEFEVLDEGVADLI